MNIYVVVKISGGANSQTIQAVPYEVCLQVGGPGSNSAHGLFPASLIKGIKRRNI